MNHYIKYYFVLVYTFYSSSIFSMKEDFFTDITAFLGTPIEKQFRSLTDDTRILPLFDFFAQNKTCGVYINNIFSLALTSTALYSRCNAHIPSLYLLLKLYNRHHYYYSPLYIIYDCTIDSSIFREQQKINTFSLTFSISVSDNEAESIRFSINTDKNNYSLLKQSSLYKNWKAAYLPFDMLHYFIHFIAKNYSNQADLRWANFEITTLKKWSKFFSEYTEIDDFLMARKEIKKPLVESEEKKQMYICSDVAINTPITVKFLLKIIDLQKELEEEYKNIKLKNSENHPIKI